MLLSIVFSGIISFLISVTFLRKRLGLGMLVMLAFPLLGCATYIYFTMPNPQSDDLSRLLSRADLYMEREEYDKAMALIESELPNFEAHEKREDLIIKRATVSFAKGLLYAEQGAFEKAHETLKDTLEITPPDAPFLPDLRHFISITRQQLEKSNSSDQNNNE